MVLAGAVGAAGVVLPLQLAQVWTWRVFFIAPIFLLFVVPKLSARLPETKRFEVLEARAHHLEVPHEHDTRPAPAPSRAEQGDRSPAPPPPRQPSITEGRIDTKIRRFIVLGASAFFMNLFVSPSSLYQNEWLKTEQGFAGWKITLFQVLTTIPGGLAIVVGGQLADKRGRRLIGAIGVAGGVGFTVLMFLSSGLSIWAFSTLATLIGAIAVPALGVYGPELFPTGNRGLTNGGLNVIGVAGGVFGYLVAGRLADNMGGLSHAIPFLALGPLVVVIVILALYPETAHLELEEINPEDARPPESLADLEELEHELDELHAHEHAHHHRRHPDGSAIDPIEPVEHANPIDPIDPIEDANPIDSVEHADPPGPPGAG
jgi:MFS family permease